MEDNEFDTYTKNEVLRMIIQKQLTNERMLLENERQDRLRMRQHYRMNIVYSVFMVSCFVTALAALITAHNVSTGSLRPLPTTSESPIYFTP